MAEGSSETKTLPMSKKRICGFICIGIYAGDFRPFSTTKTQSWNVSLRVSAVDRLFQESLAGAGRIGPLCGTMSTAKQAKKAEKSEVEVSAAQKAPGQIEVLVRARYPLLYIVTWEEERALQEMFQVANTLGKKIYDWSIVQGMARYRASVEGVVEGKKGTKDPIVALREIFAMSEPS